MKKFNKKGFTLAELLIVVAIIAVLVAVAIPIFSAQLNKAKYATDEANARSIYGLLAADFLADGHVDAEISGAPITANSAAGSTVTVTLDGTVNKFDMTGYAGLAISQNSDGSPKVELTHPSDTAQNITYETAVASGGAGGGEGGGN